MKLIKKTEILKRWKTMSVAGFGLTGVGLACVAMILGQLIPSLLEGEAPSVSTFEIAVETTLGLSFLMIGFALMVVGSDPFEDVSDEFDFRKEHQDAPR